MRTYLRDTIGVANATGPTTFSRCMDVQDEGRLEIIYLLGFDKEVIKDICNSVMKPVVLSSIPTIPITVSSILDKIFL